MRTLNHTLRASTLVELLVTMLVAGIVLLAAMEGLGIVVRLQQRRAEALRQAAAQREGCERIAALLLEADSLTGPDGRLRIHRAEDVWVLERVDSVLLCRHGAFADTLLQGIETLHLDRCDAAADTLEIGVEGHRLRFPLLPSRRRSYETQIARIENDHGYPTP